MGEKTEPPGRGTRKGGSEGEVVRLPVEEKTLADCLEPIPATAPRERIKPTQDPVMLVEPRESAEFKDPETIWDEERSKRGPTPLGWIGLVGVVLLIVGGWAVPGIWRGEEHLEGEAERVEAIQDEEQEADEAARRFLNRVETAVSTYLGAGTIDEKVRQVRHPGRVRPLMERYYQTHELRSLGLETIGVMHPVSIENFPFIYLRARDVEGGAHSFVIEQQAGGALRFDWESEVSYQPIPLAEFIARKPAEGMDFRVYLKGDEHYAYEFADQERFRSLYLTVRGSDEYLFGYVERGTETERRIVDYLESGRTRALPALLRLRFLPATRARRSVLVEEMLAPRWAYLHDPDWAHENSPDPE